MYANNALYFTGYLARLYANIFTRKKCEKLKILHDMREYIYTICMCVCECMCVYVCVYVYMCVLIHI